MKKIITNICEIVLLAIIVCTITTAYTNIRANAIDAKLAEIHRLLELPIEVEIIE